MAEYKSRWLEKRLSEALEAHPAIVLTGPRQVGKSTLLENAKFLKDWRYLTLDDDILLEQAEEDPKGLLWDERPTIIDEVQRCPKLLVTIKYYVDRSKRSRKYIISGSGNISLRQAPRETLAGRAKYLHLTGFSYKESKGLSSDGILDKIWQNQKIKASTVQHKNNIEQTVWKGSLPGIVLASNERIALERLDGYIDTYIERDIKNLLKIRHPENFRKLMQALSRATGWESTQEELSKHSGEGRVNVSRYLSLLKDTDLLYDLKGYTEKNERAYKQSKYYWFDSGAACFLSGIFSCKELENQHYRGRYFENYILQQILSWASLQIVVPRIYYWKPKNSEAEVDFILSSAGKTVPIEVKSSKKLSFKNTRSMRLFLKAHPEAGKGIIVYSGNEIYPVATNIYAVPWTAL